MLNFPQAALPATHARVVHSAMANDQYLVSIALPFHYEERPDRAHSLRGIGAVNVIMQFGHDPGGHGAFIFPEQSLGDRLLSQNR